MQEWMFSIESPAGEKIAMRALSFSLHQTGATEFGRGSSNIWCPSCEPIDESYSETLLLVGELLKNNETVALTSTETGVVEGCRVRSVSTTPNGPISLGIYTPHSLSELDQWFRN